MKDIRSIFINTQFRSPIFFSDVGISMRKSQAKNWLKIYFSSYKFQFQYFKCVCCVMSCWMYLDRSESYMFLFTSTSWMYKSLTHSKMNVRKIQNSSEKHSGNMEKVESKRVSIKYLTFSVSNLINLLSAILDHKKPHEWCIFIQIKHSLRM